MNYEYTLAKDATHQHTEQLGRMTARRQHRQSDPETRIHIIFKYLTLKQN